MALRTTCTSSSRSSTTSRQASEVDSERTAEFAQGGFARARGRGRASLWRSRGGRRWPRRRPSRRRQRPAQTAIDQAYAKYKDLQEGKNADYIPALAKVDPNIFGIALVTVDGKVYTTGDITSRGVDPVDLQGVHDGEGHGGAGPAGDREQHGRGRDRPGLQLDRRGRAVQGRRDERDGQPGRHHRDQHGDGRHPRRDLGEDPRHVQRLRGPAAHGQLRTSSSPKPRPTSATRRSRC